MSNRALDIALDYEVPEAGSPVLVASVYSDEPQEVGTPGFISPDEAEANARLIAAAPELLAACKALMPEGWDEGHMDHMPGIKLARLAIARAEGVQP
jgi:hypothetical protein